jgi:hypothetical protein
MPIPVLDHRLGMQIPRPNLGSKNYKIHPKIKNKFRPIPGAQFHFDKLSWPNIGISHTDHCCLWKLFYIKLWPLIFFVGEN